MKRRDLSQDELTQVIRLKQAGTSWVKIQKETGINRRTAKRAYEEWEHSQSRNELKAVRKDVAAEEFRKHLQCLIKLAQSLVNALGIPGPDEMLSGKEVLLSLWRSDIAGEYGAYGLPDVGGRFQGPEIHLRQNQMLFESLKDHTREKRWDALNEWECSWDKCIRIFGKLRKEAHKVVENILDQEEKGLLDRIEEGNKRKDPIAWMTKAMFIKIREGILDDKLDPESPIVENVARGDGTIQVRPVGIANVSLNFTDISIAEKVAGICNWAAKNLYKRDTFKKLADEVKTTQRKIEELQEMLNPLTLVPQILSTRCGLCPV